jgi:hypothetical protein
MKKFLLLHIILLFNITLFSQSCPELITKVRELDSGTTYSSYNSDAISKVTFHEVMVDYRTSYFAIVCFKKEYSYSCNEYIYKVSSNTKFNYSISYMNSAGKAFWKYIQPYNQNLECGPSFD